MFRLLYIGLVTFILCVINSDALAIPSSIQQGNEGGTHFIPGSPLTKEEFNSIPRYIRGGNNHQARKSLANDVKIPEINPTADGGGKGSVVSTDRFLRWPNATVPYLISAAFSDVQRQVIASAINEYHKNTCIRFVPRTNEPDYVTFVTNPIYGSEGLGRQGGPQVVSLSDDCVCLAEQNCEYLGVYVVQHELMHVLGWYHEQSRYDRDDYVIINWDNIEPVYQGQYRKINADSQLFLGTLYDTSSIMHYLTYDYAIDPTIPTMVAIDGSPLASDYLTETDILELNRMYCKAPGDCWDDHVRTGNCTQLVAEGQCQSNTAAMFDKCIQSCQFCDYPSLDLQPDPDCANFNPNCETWSGDGRCESDFDNMSINCRRACKLCSPCEDLYANCPSRALNGDCTKADTNVFMTSFCKRSCQLCS